VKLCVVVLSALGCVTFGYPQNLPAPQGDVRSLDSKKLKCKIEGKVVDLSTSEPLNKATLRLRTATPAAASVTAPPAGDGAFNYISKSDAAGGFVFEEIEPGAYWLSAERAGFVRQNYGARSTTMQGVVVKLDAGQELKDVLFQLTPQGAIRGRVVDEDGDPIGNARVQALHWTYWSGGRKQLSPVGSTSTAADGSFVATNLSPGTYYLSATPTTGWTPDQAGRKGPEETYANVFYQDALEPSAAAPIQVFAGADIRGIEVRMRKVRVFRIRGKALDTATGASLQNVTLRLLAKDSSDYFDAMLYRRLAVVRNNSFEFAAVPPGTYVIEPDIAANHLVGRCVVTVSQENVGDLVCPLGPGQEVMATIGIAEGHETGQQPSVDGRKKPPSQPSLSFLAVDGFPTIPAIQKLDNGSFRIHNVPPNRFRVNVSGLPEGTFIKAMRFNNQDWTQPILDLTSGAGGSLQIILADGAAGVTGVVRNSKGEAMPGVVVTLWSPDRAMLGAFDPAKAAYTDQNGAFRIENLGPGDYRILAWDDFDAGLMLNLDFLKRFESQASSIKLEENSRETVDVKLADRDSGADR